MNDVKTPDLVTTHKLPEGKPRALPPVPKSKPRSSAWDTFFSLTGGSILYCLSAMSIIFGISNLLGPNLASANIMREAIPSLAALNVYEIALLGVLTMIVVWQNVLDDAISLVILVALFLVGSGLTLSSVANNGHQAALLIGLAAFGIGAVKMLVLRTAVGLKISIPSYCGLLLLLAWNFLSGALHVRSIVAGCGDASRAHWQLSWLVFLAGGFIILAEAITRTRSVRPADSQRVPFLHTPAMFWIFVTILIGAGGVHQYVLGYIFDVKTCLGDYLPLVTLVTLLLLQLCITLKSRAGTGEGILALIPLGTCIIALLNNSVAAGASWSPELLWYPPVLLGLTGLLILWMGLRVGNLPLQKAGLIYFLGIIFTWGFSPERPGDLHWYLTGGLVLSGLYITGLIRNKVPLCVIAVVIATMGIVFSGTFTRFTVLHRIDQFTATLGIAGLGLIGTALVFGRRAPAMLAGTGSGLVAMFLFDYLGKPRGQAELIVLSAVVPLAVSVWLRTGKWVASAILCLPLGRKLWDLLMRLTAWRYVFLSFILLFAGAWLSVHKGKKLKGMNREINGQK